MEFRFVEGIDCRQGLTKLNSNSISLVLADPPYFLDGMDDKWNSSQLFNKAKSSGVVGSLPVGMKFDKKQGERLHKFMFPVAKEVFRVIKPGGFFLCFSQNRLVHRMGMALEDAGFEIRDVLAWKYEGQAKAFTQDHFIRKRNISKEEKERLIKKLGGRKTPQLKPQCELIVLAQAPRDGTFVDNFDRYETGLIDVSNPYIQPSSFPGTIIPCKKSRSKFKHMTIKPVDLLRHLIRIFSVKGAKVLDPFAGSGSTGVAALMEKRKFIGFEIDIEMAKKSEKRIKEYNEI